MKISALFVLIVTLAVLGGSAQVPAPAAKPDDGAKNLDLVEKTVPVPETFKTGFDTISAKDSLAMLTFIGSDLMEGRETGTRGFQAAAEYAASLFGLSKLKPIGDMPVRSFGMMQRLGLSQAPPKPLENTYLQEFPLVETVETSSALSLEVRQGGSVRTHTFRPVVDYQGLAASGDTLSGPVVFVGYGIGEKGAGFDEFKGIDVKGKVVMLISGVPGFLSKDIKARYPMPSVSPMTPPAAGEGSPAEKRVDRLRDLRQRGAAAVLLIRGGGRDVDRWRALMPQKSVNDEGPIVRKSYHRVSLPGEIEETPWTRSAVVTITPGAADRILEAAGMTLEDLKKKIETSKKSASLEIPGAFVTMTSTLKTQTIRGINVVGVIEGSDPTLKNEAMVIGAHLDHEGRWEDYIYNGADDNGSGSVGVLNLARAFAANPQKPKRTLVFCLWCGEEEGLLGSKYFVTHPPQLLKAKIVSYLNFDMISRPYDEKSMAFAGRMMSFPYGPDFIKRVKPANFVPVSFPVGAAFGEIIRAANKYVGLDVYVREAKRTDVGFGDSDHTSFHEAKIPWIWPFTAVTEDLHQTSDSADKVSGELMEKVSKLMYVIAWLAADK
ncbi:MAG: M20/M25/M40 family metallo-hydrolase [Candidatus Aminicenantes bacterium]|nr:M20/M25/M40 family metallo-hydrolase [Candidatus Aminicenantes bacterium]